MTVLDASALLAYLLDEPGGERVERAIVEGALIGAVNLAEVLGKLADGGRDPVSSMDAISALPFEVLPFEGDDALETALLRTATATAGLSLADRACLALGRRLGRPVLTADRAWLGLAPGVEVVSVR